MSLYHGFSPRYDHHDQGDAGRRCGDGEGKCCEAVMLQRGNRDNVSQRNQGEEQTLFFVRLVVGLAECGGHADDIDRDQQ